MSSICHAFKFKVSDITSLRYALVTPCNRGHHLTVIYCAITCGTCANMLRGCRVGKWCPKFPKSLMLLAHNSKTCLCLLESIFVVSCSSLRKVRQWVELRHVPIYITDVTKCVSCFISTRAPHYSHYST